ncbi:MAG: tetratricopeptide repeat protein [Bacteroidaceae bacterium]|nr:tetratricopeptide repeat protein [Bacteroidaceae bacterium]
MKNCIYLVLSFVLFCVASCHHNPSYPSSLLMADSLTYVAPRQALQMIDSIREEMAQADKPTRMYHQLLSVKAQDKAYIPHTSDSLMLSLVDYYEHEGDKSLLPEAYYYLGSIYRDLKDAPRALDAFQKALDVVDKTPSSLLRMIHNQMGWLFYRQKMYDEAMTSYLQGYRCDSLLKDTFEMSSDLINIAYIYQCKDDSLSSLSSLFKARELAKSIDSQLMLDEADIQIAGLFIEMGKDEKAKQLIQSPLKRAIPSNISSIYSIAAKAYLHVGETDSASYLFKVLLKEGNIYAQRAAYEGLANIAVKENDMKKAADYFMHFRQTSDSIQHISAIESVAQMKSLYDYQLREKENLQLQQQKERLRNNFIITALIGIILITLLTASVFYYRRRQHLLALQMSLMKHHTEEQYKKTTAYIEHNKEEIVKLTEQIANLLKEINVEKEVHHNEKQTLLEELELQRQKIEQQNRLAEIEIKERSEVEKKILASEIYQKLKLSIDSKSLITDDMLGQLGDLLNKHYPNFKSVIQSSDLSKINYAICMLTKIGIQSIDIATLVGRERSTITKAKPKIYKKITGLDGKVTDFDNYIQLV